MIRHATAIMLLAIAAGTGAETRAEEMSKWGDTAGWAILIDPGNANGCLMEKKLESGTLVQFGMVPDRDGGFFALYNPDWSDIKDGATGVVTLEFPKKRFVGDVAGVAKEGRFGGYAFFDNPNVTVEFGKNNEMTVVGELGRNIEVGLSGTMKAIQAVKACQSEQSE